MWAWDPLSHTSSLCCTTIGTWIPLTLRQMLRRPSLRTFALKCYIFSHHRSTSIRQPAFVAFSFSCQPGAAHRMVRTEIGWAHDICDAHYKAVPHMPIVTKKVVLKAKFRSQRLNMNHRDASPCRTPIRRTHACNPARNRRNCSVQSTFTGHSCSIHGPQGLPPSFARHWRALHVCTQLQASRFSLGGTLNLLTEISEGES